MGTIYATFSVMTDKGTGVGRITIEAAWNGYGPAPSLRFSEIQAIEKKALARWQQDDPSSRNLFLLDWKWLRDEQPDLET